MNGVTTDYAAGFIYENDVLQFINQPEGYVEPTTDPAKPFLYIYQYKDHLGNIRLSYKDISLTSMPSLQIVEENNYYPFGLKHKGYNTAINGIHHKYMFGGKEQQDELGLNWYDITARNYDPALGRWMNVDPLAELMWTWSPYNYSFDSPIYFSDPTGFFPDDFGSNATTDYYRKDGVVYFDPKVGPDNVPKGATYIGPTYYDEGTGTFWDEKGNPNSVTEQLNEVVISNKPSKVVYHGITIYGINGFGPGVNDGRRGISDGSVDMENFVIPLGGGAPTVSALARLLRWLTTLFSQEQNVEKAVNSNKSTMEKKVSGLKTAISIIKENSKTREKKMPSGTTVIVLVKEDTTVYIKDLESVYNLSRKRSSRKLDSIINNY